MITELVGGKGHLSTDRVFSSQEAVFSDDDRGGLRPNHDPAGLQSPASGTQLTSLAIASFA